MSNKEKITNFIGKTLLVALGVGSTVWAFTDAFSVKVNLLFLWIFVFFTAFIFSVIMRLKHKNIVVLIMCAFMIGLIVIFHKYIGYGLYGIANSVLGKYNDYYDVNIGLFTIDKKPLLFIDTQRGFNTLFISVVVIEYVYILTTATMYKIFTSIHYIMSITLLIIPLMLGVFPGIFPTVLVTYYFLVCAMEGKSKNIHLVRMAVMGVIVGIITGITLLCVNPSRYDGEKRNQKTREIIEEVALKLNLDFLIQKGIGNVIGKGDYGVGGINGGRLGEIDSVKLSGDVMLELYMDNVGEDVYLKGFVANNYEYNRWKPAVVGQKAIYEMYGAENNTNIYKSITQDFDNLADTFSYKNTNYMVLDYVKQNNDYTFFPYYSDVRYWDNESYVMPKSTEKSRCQYVFYSIDFDEAIYTWSPDPDGDILYSEVSMGIPDEITEYFDRIIPKDVRYDGTVESIKNCEQFIRDYLKTNTRYTLSPGEVTPGEDFVLDFLIHKRKGYCTSYATTATMMFRYMGIPARYVEGYIVTRDEQEKAQSENDKKIILVKDDSAHAWTEIYISGFGFVPVETTPGYYEDEDETRETNDNGSSENNTDTTEKKEDSSKNNTETTTKKNEVTTKKSDSNKDGGTKSDSGTESGTYKWLIIALVIICTLVAVIYFGRDRSGIYKNPDYKTEDNRHNIKVLAVILEKELEKKGIECGKNISTDDLASNINEVIDEIKNSEKIKAKKEKGVNITIPDSDSTKEVLFIMNKCKYADENVKFSEEEIIKVSKYVEELKNCLHYVKNRL